MNPDRIFLLADSNTRRHCLPLLSTGAKRTLDFELMEIPAGDINKNLRTAEQIWTFLSENGATRRSLMINLGGGMITDIGGFTASSFKRGIRFVNIPTTLLGAVDASVGGKTGINFNGFKNEVGFFAFPHAVIISTIFFKTLPADEMTSGYAEAVKMAYVFNAPMVDEMLACDPAAIGESSLLRFMDFCVRKKDEVTRADMREGRLRKLLNFGHTAAHAFESLSHARMNPIRHGEAVAYGMLFALIASKLQLEMPSDVIYPYVAFLREHYHRFPFGCRDVDTLIEYMGHDKKNAEAGKPLFILLENPGRPRMDCALDKDTLSQTFEIFMDFLG